MARTPTVPAAPPDRRPIPALYWKAAALSGMASYLDAALIVGISVNLALWRDNYHMSVWMAGATSAIVTLCIAVGSLVGGRLGDLFGRRRVYNLDILCYALGALLITAAPNDVILLAGIVIAGLAAGADLPTSLAVVSDAAPAWARGRLVAFTQVMWVAGIAVITALGFALSTLGMTGARLITGHLALAALVTWALRARLKLASEADGPQEAPAEGRGTGDAAPGGAVTGGAVTGGPTTGEAAAGKAVAGGGTSWRMLLDRSVMTPMVATFAFYVAWGLGANTFGQFSTYLLVTVSGASQSLATGIGLASVPIGLLLTLGYVRVADGAWRDRLFYAAATVQVVAFATASISGGTALSGMLAFFLLYQLSNPFAGEASYKVWSQLALPAQTRATTQGLTYALSRAVFAIAAFFTPALLAYSSALLLWTVTALMAVAGLAGVYIIRVLVPRTSTAAPTALSTQPAEA
jgi:inositol transporter-like SP family MFS transporter